MRANRPSAVRETKRVHRCDDSVHVSLCVLGLKFFSSCCSCRRLCFSVAGRETGGGKPRDDSAGGALGMRPSVGPGLPDLVLLTGGGKRWGAEEGVCAGARPPGKGRGTLVGATRDQRHFDASPRAIEPWTWLR